LEFVPIGLMEETIVFTSVYPIWKITGTMPLSLKYQLCFLCHDVTVDLCTCFLEGLAGVLPASLECVQSKKKTKSS